MIIVQKKVLWRFIQNPYYRPKTTYVKQSLRFRLKLVYNVGRKMSREFCDKLDFGEVVKPEIVYKGPSSYY